MSGSRLLVLLTLLAGELSVGLAADPPTFAHDVAPILYLNCSPCHRPQETGPFSLLSYNDARKWAGQIAAVTHSRYMPPWLPEPGHGNFEGERRLTDQEIRTIADWAAAGAPEGPAGETPKPPNFPTGWPMGAPDLILEAPATYHVPASGPDVYWNFVLKPNQPVTRYVRAIEIRPGDRKLVHHANLLVDRWASSHLREATPGGGFPGMNLEIMRSPFDPPGHLLFWKPGSVPHQEPEGLAWRLDPGDELVLNVHLHPSGKPEEIRPAIGLYFTDKAPTKLPLLVQMENDQALDVPPGAQDFEVKDDFRLTLDVDALAVYPHAHYLGKVLEAYATLPDGQRQWLIRIPDWNPDWQAVFYYREPVFLPKGTVISMRYRYDNSAANLRNPHQPPVRVESGDQSTDEMAHLWLELLPRGPGDRRRELEEAVMRHRLEKNPKEFAANFNLGAVMLSRLNAAGAVGALETAVAAEPSRPEARNMLGVALGRVGRNAEALAEFEIAVKLRPGYTAARFNLADAQMKAGRLDDAISNLKLVVEANPSDPLPKRKLEEALAAKTRR
ncbi:MAG TPA: tetratricopeptide repeat protein [Bryobacteraceae bacterium]|nr:tetratricopeptide repeat protein [Bryobacteraceae bacterium]